MVAGSLSCPRDPLSVVSRAYDPNLRQLVGVIGGLWRNTREKQAIELMAKSGHKLVSLIVDYIPSEGCTLPAYADSLQNIEFRTIERKANCSCNKHSLCSI